MPNIKIYMGDVGTVFRATIKDRTGKAVNVNSASVMKMKFKKPNGVVIEKNMVPVTTGTDGKVQYITQFGDLDMRGVWRVQGYIEIGGSIWRTNIHAFSVFKPL